MKIATFNINGVNGPLPNLLEWLGKAEPDVVALQEIKCTDAAFLRAELERAGYGVVWRGQGPHHGVALLARGVAPVLTRRELPGDPDDREARYIEAAVNGVLIGCIYLPDGNPQPGPKFGGKLRWFERLRAYAAELIAADLPALLIGDFNVVPTDGDIYDARSHREDALLQPEPRAAYARLLAQGWTDALGDLHPGEALYTSGTTSAIVGGGMPAYALITCWSRPSCCHGSRTGAPTARCVADRTPATTLPRGSSSPRERPRLASGDAGRPLLRGARTPVAVQRPRPARNSAPGAGGRTHGRQTRGPGHGRWASPMGAVSWPSSATRLTSSFSRAVAAVSTAMATRGEGTARVSRGRS